MQVLAARIGARVEVHRTPQALVYEVSGPRADLDFLGWILREGVKAPTADAFEDARRRLRTELDRQLETPQGVLYARARAALSPGSAQTLGSVGAVERMDHARLLAFWNRTHRADSVRLVVAGRIPMALVLASFGDPGLPGGAPQSVATPASPAGEPRSTPQVVRNWTVQARALPAGSEAAALVAARWIGEILASDNGDYESAVEIWSLPAGRALVLTGAAYPRGRQAMERRIGSILGDAAARITPAEVRRIAEAVRTEVLMTARSPWGFADLVGQAWDAGNGPEGVEAFIGTLINLDPEAVRSLLTSLAAATPVRAELNP